jgi:hypothetical protein
MCSRACGDESDCIAVNLGGEYGIGERASEESDRKIDFHLDQIFVGTKKRACNEEFEEKQLSSLLFFVAGTPRYFFALMSNE